MMTTNFNLNLKSIRIRFKINFNIVDLGYFIKLLYF
jgi:hypothetical protein